MNRAPGTDVGARLRNAAAVTTWLAMVATPLNRRRGRARRVLSSIVVGGLAATTAAAASRRWGPPRAVAALAAVGGATAVVERVGTRTGIPFGRYAYTGALRPHLRGVPVIVPLAWFAMAVPARETAHAALGGRSRRWSRIVGGATALTAWDLFLDPQMVGEGYWAWARAGRYRGIPLTNFVGWFVTGLGVMTMLELALPVDERGGEHDGTATGSAASVDLVAEYATMAAMETLGFAAFFRDRLVAVVGGAAMVPIAVAGAFGTARTGRTDRRAAGRSR